MEYEIKASIVPAEQDSTYYFRVFVTGHEENRLAGARCIFAKRIHLIDPHDESPAQIWAILAVRSLLAEMDRDLTEEVSVGKATLMHEVAEREIILRGACRQPITRPARIDPARTPRALPGWVFSLASSRAS